MFVTSTFLDMHAERDYLREPLPYDQMPPERAAEFSEEHSTEPGAANQLRRCRDPTVRIHWDWEHARWSCRTNGLTS